MDSNALSSSEPSANQSTEDPFSAIDIISCETKRYWYVFLCSSLVTFLVSLLLVVGWRLLAWIFRKRCADNSQRSPGVAEVSAQQLGRGQSNGGIEWITKAQDGAGELISESNETGRILVRIANWL